MRLKFLLAWASWGGLAWFGMASGCGSTASQVGQQNGPVGGGACERVGATTLAPDGCNTCTCQSNHEWACTIIACGTQCHEGDTKPSPDGCNTCTCTQNQWACTDKACLCTPGQTRPAGDGCNTCSCSADHEWGCTLINCHPDACTPGQTKPAGDGCNTCTCQANQEWACTIIGCLNCPAPRTPPDGSACDTVSAWVKSPSGFGCCEYSTACNAPEGLPTYRSQSECLGAPQCPAPAESDGGSCPPVTVYARDPATGICCFYSDPCRAPQGWPRFPSEAECNGT